LAERFEENNENSQPGLAVYRPKFGPRTTRTDVYNVTGIAACSMSVRNRIHEENGVERYKAQ